MSPRADVAILVKLSCGGYKFNFLELEVARGEAR